MYSNQDDQHEQTDRQHAAVTQQLLGSREEEEYFGRKEIELRRTLARERQEQLLAEERERARALHHMKCPKCGMQLEEIVFSEVRIDKCFSCEGVWLDKGELDAIRQKDGDFIGRVLNVFR